MTALQALVFGVYSLIFVFAGMGTILSPDLKIHPLLKIVALIVMNICAFMLARRMGLTGSMRKWRRKRSERRQERPQDEPERPDADSRRDEPDVPQMPGRGPNRPQLPPPAPPAEVHTPTRGIKDRPQQLPAPTPPRELPAATPPRELAAPAPKPRKLQQPPRKLQQPPRELPAAQTSEVPAAPASPSVGNRAAKGAVEGGAATALVGLATGGSVTLGGIAVGAAKGAFASGSTAVGEKAADKKAAKKANKQLERDLRKGRTSTEIRMAREQHGIEPPRGAHSDPEQRTRTVRDSKRKVVEPSEIYRPGEQTPSTPRKANRRVEQGREVYDIYVPAARTGSTKGKA